MKREKIKKLDDFFDMLSEAFDNPVNIRWVDGRNMLRGLFTINDNIYQIVCDNKGDNIWRYDFYFYEKCNNEFTPKMTGIEKDKFRVLPTVESGINYFFRDKNPDAIIFGASDKSRGRKKIYEGFCEKFAEINNLKFYTKIYTDSLTNIDRQIFILYKNDIDMDILTKTIYEILKEEKFGI
jgi:hypothetical protein